MSKGSQFWGNASGKLGEQVLYRAGGEQRSRTYVAKIKNPRTYAQMKNRLLMLNVVSAFRALKPLLSETFPQKKANQSAFNAFVSANKNNNAYYIAKSDLESGACVPYGMQISKGALGMLLQPTLTELKDAIDLDASSRYGWTLTGLLDLTNFKKTYKRVDDPAHNYVWWPTEQELAEIFKNHCVVNLPSQFQLSVISAFYAAEDSDMAQDMWQPNYSIYHCQNLNSYKRTYGITSEWPEVKIGLRVSSYERGDDEKDAVYHFDSVVIGTAHLSPDDAALQALGLILSFKENGKTMVSTSRIGVVPNRVGDWPLTDPTLDYIEGGFYFEQVLEEYGYKADGILTSQVTDKPETPEDDEDDEVVEDA